MKILVLNCGSSSVKYKLIESADGKVLAEGGVEKLGLPDSFIKFKLADGSKKVVETLMPTHKEAVETIIKVLTDPKEGVIKSMDEIDAVGHRVVHGMDKFSQSVLITPEVKEKIKECYTVAPLHNPANMTGIDAITALMPAVPQVAVFDTAFHQTMPAKSFMYALPYKYYAEDGVRRYGFHGTSHRYVSQRAAEFLGVDIKTKKIITCHIGNGASITAVDGGKCVDTSMGFTPLDGLVMGTRCGAVDPSAITYIMEKEGFTPAEMNEYMNKKCGYLGISGFSSDSRDLEAAIVGHTLFGEPYEATPEQKHRAMIAVSMMAYEVQKYIGSYTAAMNGLDALVFTAGMGENNPELRERVCTNMEFFGIKLDREKNSKTHHQSDNVEISTPDSRVKVYVLPTNEELAIARDTERIVNAAK